MTSSGATPYRERVRPAARHDVSALVDLRVRYLGESARLARKPALPVDARSRAEALWPVWVEQEGRIVLVAPGKDGALAGYAMGSLGAWPPLFRRTRVGEVLEVFVE